MPVKTNASLLVTPAKDCSKPPGPPAGSRRILVLGLGNILLRDEGIGVHVAGRLQKQDLPDNVEVIDGGTATLDILLSEEGRYKLLVIDALRAGGKPGSIYHARLKAGQKDELPRIFGQPKESKISLHQVGLIEALVAAEKMNRAPEEVVIIGVEPGQVDCGLELTEPVRQSVPQIIEKVLEEITNAVHRE